MARRNEKAARSSSSSRWRRLPRPPALRVAGVPVRADASFLVIAALVGWSFWLRFSAVASRSAALAMAIVAAALFVMSILAHEIAHALESERRGLHVSDVTLYVFGGATAVTDEVRRSGDEFALTVVGPWTSIVLGCSFGLAAVAADHLSLSEVGFVAGELGWLNLALGIFNLLPGAPLDGGRLLHALVWRLTGDRTRAGLVSAGAGRLIGAAIVALGVVEMLWLAGGFVSGLWFVLIGWFLVRSASSERDSTMLRARLGGRRAGELTAAVPSVPGDASLEEALEAMRRSGGAEVVAVTGAAGIVGVLTLQELRRAVDEERWEAPVDEVMTPAGALASVEENDPATDLLPLLGARPVVVRQGPRAAALVTAAQLIGTLRTLPPLPAGALDEEVPRRRGDRAAARGRRPRSAAGVAGLAGALAASTAAVAAAAALVPMPLLELSPGPALDVPGMIRTSGPVHPVDGRLLLTSVRVASPTAVEVVGALFDSHRELLRQSSLVPSGMNPADYDAAQRQLFGDSVRLGAAVALRAAGYRVAISGGGAIVRAVSSTGPAAGRLYPGDVVVAVDGERIAGAADLLAHLAQVPAGRTLALAVLRGGTRLGVEVTPAWSSELARTALGIAVEDASPLVRLPFSVSVSRADLAGPSAGLMLALSVYALTTGADLTGGKTVAGTGTIDAEGAVGAVGGVAEKVAGAVGAGASVFLVPAAEAGAARQAAANAPIRVVPVGSFSAALAALRAAESRAL